MNWGVHLSKNLKPSQAESFLTVRVDTWGREQAFQSTMLTRGEGVGAPRLHSWGCPAVPTCLCQGLTRSRGSSSDGGVQTQSLQWYLPI